MNAKKLSALVLTLATLSAGLVPAAAQADDRVVLGAVIGGIAGAAIGSSMGGSNATLMGAAVGSMAGAAIGSGSGQTAPAPRVHHPVSHAVVYAPPPPPHAYRAAYVQPAYPHRVVYQDRYDWREQRAWRQRHEAREHGFQYPPHGR